MAKLPKIAFLGLLKGFIRVFPDFPENPDFGQFWPFLALFGALFRGKYLYVFLYRDFPLNGPKKGVILEESDYMIAFFSVLGGSYRDFPLNSTP